MADERSLMRPLRSDSLKPRPSTQAVWTPGQAEPRPAEAAGPVFQPAPEPAESLSKPAPVPVVEMPFIEESEPELFVEEFIPADAPPPKEMLHTFAPELRFDPCPPPQEQPEPEPEPTVPQEEEEEPFDLDAVIAAILAQDDDDEDEAPTAQDALPTEQMPEPACVPLMEMPAPKRKRKGWLWLLLIVLLIGGAYAAQHFGLLALN